MYDDIYSLNVGDIFMEDCYPEEYQIVRFDEGLVIAKDLESGEESEWGYAVPAYAPCIYKVN